MPPSWRNSRNQMHRCSRFRIADFRVALLLVNPRSRADNHLMPQRFQQSLRAGKTGNIRCRWPLVSLNRRDKSDFRYLSSRHDCQFSGRDSSPTSHSEPTNLVKTLPAPMMACPANFDTRHDHAIWNIQSKHLRQRPTVYKLIALIPTYGISFATRKTVVVGQR